MLKQEKITLRSTRECNESGCYSPARFKKTNGNYIEQWKCQSCEHLKSRYNMNTPERDKLYDSQGGCCAICNQEVFISTRKEGRQYNHAVVDHCHTTGIVRGILCHDCNIGLGKFKDNPTALETAAKYLEVH